MSSKKPLMPVPRAAELPRIAAQPLQPCQRLAAVHGRTRQCQLPSRNGSARGRQSSSARSALQRQRVEMRTAGRGPRTRRASALRFAAASPPANSLRRAAQQAQTPQGSISRRANRIAARRRMRETDRSASPRPNPAAPCTTQAALDIHPRQAAGHQLGGRPRHRRRSSDNAAPAGFGQGSRAN